MIFIFVLIRIVDEFSLQCSSVKRWDSQVLALAITNAGGGKKNNEREFCGFIALEQQCVIPRCVPSLGGFFEVVKMQKSSPVANFLVKCCSTHLTAKVEE